MPTSGAAIALGGSALVCCVHNRVKRENLEMAFDPTKTKLHVCSCCENVFTERTDTPMFCPECRGENVYPLGGPLPNPFGVVS